MQYRKLAFIGAGNMSRSIIAGLVASGYPAENIIASNRSRPKLDALATDFGIHITQTNSQACEFADAIILSVKPQMMEDLCATLQQQTQFTGKLFISIAAGLPVARLQQMLGAAYPVVRVMPNTPSLLGQGMSGLYADPSVNSQDRDYVEDVMSAVGKTLWVEKESDINGVIAAAGSSPAYFFLFLQAMQEESMRQGFSESDARQLVQQAMLGAAQMVCDNPALTLSELRAQVTSKGGTTAAAIQSLVDDDLPTIVAKAMQSAVMRAEEMANTL